MENVNQFQFTAHVKVSVGGEKQSGELKIPHTIFQIAITLFWNPYGK
jgi:hypothetical protein